MVLKVFWTNSAKIQLKNIYLYYKSNATDLVAKKLIKKIIDRTIQLETNPKSGRREPLLSKRNFEYRFLIIGNYKIIYWQDTQNIKIAAVFDCRQNPEKIKAH